MITSVQYLLKDFSKSHSVLWIFVWQQLILRYRRTLLGYVWSLINPLLMMTIMSVIFASLFKTDLKKFTIFLFAGMIPWNFFSTVVSQSCSTYILHESLIKKIYIPKIIFPLSHCLSLFIDNVLAFFTLFFIILFMGGTLSSAILFIPLAYLLLFCFTFGISLMMAVSTVFFRDLQHIIIIAMQGLFFLTPIIYSQDTLIGKAGYIVKLNPLTSFIELFRIPLYVGVIPPFALIMKAMILSLLALGIGLKFFLMQEKKLVFRL